MLLGQMFGISCRCMMDVCKGQQEVLRDLNERFSSFLEHVAQLQMMNLNLQKHIRGWKMLLERDWSSQERTVEDLQTQIRHMLIENAELALHSDHVYSTIHHLQSRCELEQKLHLRLEQLIAELKQRKINLHQANTLLEEQLHASTQEVHTMQDEQERELFVQQQQAGVREDGRGMELCRFGPAHGDLGAAALTNRAPGFRPTANVRPRRDTPSPNGDQPPQVSRGDEALREARAELTEVRKQWHSLQVEVESLHAMERSLQSSLKHTKHQYTLQLRDLSCSVSELEAELDGVREGLAAQKHHHNQLLNTKMRLEREIATYRRLLEHEEGRFLCVDGQPWKLKPWKPSSQQNGVCNGIENESEITEKTTNQGPAFHQQGSLVIFTEPIGSRDGEISMVKTQEIVEGNVVRESAEGHGRVETEKIDKVIKQWEGSFFQGNPKLRKKSVSLRFDLHMAMADEGCAQSKKDSLPDVEVRLVMKRSRSIPTITQ
ncbi:keratin-like protein KRT222 isoform X1 [Tachysurus vachellii]|nr:keratin-like protein KRT222 isoform X1 [Tachysurus vachellii]